MPEGFLHATELGAVGTSLLDALSFSLVTLSTLGYGDVSPSHGLLRLAAPLEALLGLGLLTASVSWLLSIFPVLSRRRALAYGESASCRRSGTTGPTPARRSRCPRACTPT